MDEFLAQLRTKFQLHDVGEPKVFCGLEIQRNREEGWLKISQKGFTEDLVERFMTVGQPVYIPAPAKIKVPREGQPLSEEQSKEYRTVVGSLLWLATRTRPDISYIVGVLTRFFAQPTKEQWEVALGVIKYLKGTSDLGLVFGKGAKSDLLGYSDADWAGDQFDKAKSMTGFCFILGGAAVAWMAKLQSCVATLLTTRGVYGNGISSARGCVDPNDFVRVWSLSYGSNFDAWR